MPDGTDITGAPGGGKGGAGGPTYGVTVTVKELETEFPELSVAVQVTIVLPTGNGPGLLEQLTDGAGSTASVALGRPNETFAPAALVAGTVWLPGMLESDGGVVSWTVTVNEPEAVWRDESCTVQVTVVSPSGNVPLPGEHCAPA
jgi:hypothetical protein